MTPIVVLRAPERAAATLAAIAAAGGEAIAHPLFALVPLAWQRPPNAFDALALTSANAVTLAGAGLDACRDLPAWAVGAATAHAAQAAGLTVAHVGDAGAARLFEAMRMAGVRRGLWLAAEDRAIDPPAWIDAVAVYRAEPLAHADAAAVAGRVVLVHSARAAAQLAGLLDIAARRGTALVAISAAAAAAAGPGWRSIDIAARPDDAAIVAAAIDRARAPSDKQRQ